MHMNICGEVGGSNDSKYTVQDDALRKPLVDTPVTRCDPREIWVTERDDA